LIADARPRPDDPGGRDDADDVQGGGSPALSPGPSPHLEARFVLSAVSREEQRENGADEKRMSAAISAVVGPRRVERLVQDRHDRDGSRDAGDADRGQRLA
jgi:hypothetical protein